MRTLLIVEDNVRLCASLIKGFTENGVVAVAVTTGRAAIERLKQDDLDAMILDLGLPDMDGVDVLAISRQTGIVAPVLILSARDTVEERVRLLESGADDYLVKPFVFAELVARIRALVRRIPMPPRDASASADLQLETQSACVRVGPRSVPLSPREFALLQHLTQRAGQVASRREILADVFGYGFDPGTNVIDVHIAHLRRKLGGTPVQIETVRGQGYRLATTTAAQSRAQ